MADKTKGPRPAPTHGEMEALTAERDRLLAEIEDLQWRLAELRYVEASSTDLSKSLGAKGAYFERKP